MDAENTKKIRQSVVAIVGHVDHGKTTLLDYIRKTNVAAREAGGITQAVGAYEIDHGGKKITFIDTPGHEAFITMRSRGASIADLAVLVVAGDEGVKPQTKESIRILEETKTPFVVAITKTDKPNADLEKVKQDLTSANVFLEGFGGQISFQPVSAKTGEGVNDLLDLILLTAEVEGLAYDPASPASGFILESRRTKTRGVEVTVIVKEGTLKRGEAISTPSAGGKVRILENFLEKQINELSAGAPAIIIGFEELPSAGEAFTTGEKAHPTPRTMSKQNSQVPQEGNEKTLNLILKSSDGGSLEALSQIVRAMGEKEGLCIIDESVGEITEGDVKLAVSTKSVIISFKTKIDKAAKALAQAKQIEIVSSEIIYELTQAIDALFKKLATPGPEGTLEVLAIFNQTKSDRQVVGGRVIQGFFKNKSLVQIMRGESRVNQGRVLNLQEGKKDTASVPEGKECGLLLNSPELIKVGDKLVIANESR